MKQAKSEEKKRFCPFNQKLECENCRLYIGYVGGRKSRECAFIISTGTQGGF